MAINPLVSIVMPMKNAGPFIEATIHSILAQSHSHWELIVIDDHSTDNSPEKVLRFAKRDRRIKMFKNTGSGILDALCTGQKFIAGQFLSRMDADDLMTEDRIKHQLLKLDETGSGHVVTGLVSYFSEEGINSGYKKYEQWLNQLCLSNSHYREIYRECVLPSPGWMMHTADFLKIGGFEGLDYPEDYDFVFRLYQNQIPIVSLNKTVLLWRDHPGRASRNLVQYRDQTFFSLKWRRFLEIDRISSSPLILYGAGPKGKKLAREILKTTAEFFWVSGNIQKQGKHIYGQPIKSEALLKKYNHPQVLIAISAPDAQNEISRKTNHLQKVYYFC